MVSIVNVQTFLLILFPNNLKALHLLPPTYCSRGLCCTATFLSGCQVYSALLATASHQLGQVGWPDESHLTFEESQGNKQTLIFSYQ